MTMADTEQNSSKTNWFWGAAVAGVGLVGVLLGSVLDVVALEEKFTEGPQLAVAIDYGPFAVPSGYTPEPVVIESKGDAFKIPRTPPNGLIVLSIQNIGTHAAKNVNIICQYRGYYTIRHMTGDREDGDLNKEVSVGDLGQAKDATVYLWTYNVPEESDVITVNRERDSTSYRLQQQQEQPWTSYVALAVAAVLLGAAIVGYRRDKARLWQMIARQSQERAVLSRTLLEKESELHHFARTLQELKSQQNDKG